jgi:hypothetical protein
MSSEAAQGPLPGVVRIGLWIGAATTALLLAISCTGVSVTFEGAPFPIGSKDDALDKPGLLGVWEYSDPGALYAFVKEHAHDDSLYGEPVVYQRVALWARTTLYTSLLE